MRGIKIILGDEEIHTGASLDLVQEEKRIGSPEVQTYKVAVPGRNGLLDLSANLTGSVCYNNRSLEFRYIGTGSRRRLLWLGDVMRRYHGRTIQIVDDDTPDEYYTGEASVEVETFGAYVSITLSVDAQPFRTSLATYIQTLILSAATQTIEIQNPGVDTVPTVSLTGSASFTVAGKTIRLSPGTYTDPGFRLSPGSNAIQVSGSGSLTFEYREAFI